MVLSYEQKLAIFEDNQYGMERYSIKPNKTNFRYKGKVIVREMREGSTVAYILPNLRTSTESMNEAGYMFTTLLNKRLGTC